MKSLHPSSLVLAAAVAPAVLAMALQAPRALAGDDDPGEQEEDESDDSPDGEEGAAETDGNGDEGDGESGKAAASGEKAKKGKKAKKSEAQVLLPVSEKGATVLLDGEEVGVTPLAPLTGLTVGTHTLRVDKEGFYTYTADLDVPEEGQLRHDVLLDGGASQKTELPAIMKKWWFWTAVSAVVLTGATVGIYFGVKEEPPDAVKFPPY